MTNQKILQAAINTPLNNIDDNRFNNYLDLHIKSLEVVKDYKQLETTINSIKKTFNNYYSMNEASQKCNDLSNMLLLYLEALNEAIKKYNIENIINYLEELKIETDKSELNKLIEQLQSLIEPIQDDNTKSYLKELINTIKHQCYRSTVIISWIGAISILRNYLFNNKNELDKFNIEVKKRLNYNEKLNIIKVTHINDFNEFKDGIFLDIIKNTGIIDDAIKKRLKNCLDLRNSCGHHNNLIVDEYEVFAHVEVLIINIYKRFLI